MFRESFITHRMLALALAPAAILAPAPALTAQEADDGYLGEAPERYAQVKVLEGEARIFKGDHEETLTRGVPVAEGDIIDSRGRGILQLGDGTRIAFAGGTRFQVLALFTDRKGEREVTLRLERGRLRIQVGRDSDGLIRVDAPGGSGSLEEADGGTFEVDGDRTTRVRIHAGRITFTNASDRVRLNAGERLTVYSDKDRLDRIRTFNTFELDAFDEWAERGVTPRRSASWDKVPSEIRYYSDELDGNGEWIWVEELGQYCWRPTGVANDWRPYYYNGYWGAYAGGMTWVSGEPWGYVTYHYGRWGWAAGWGWYWAPGAYYSPAWVAWGSQGTYFGWAPLGYYGYPVAWGYGPWAGGYCWNVVSYHNIHHHNIHHHIHTDVNVINTFNHGTGSTTWRGGGAASGNPLTPPWQRGPAMVTRQEMRNPAELQRALSQRSVQTTRLRAYEQQAQATTGRTILRRDPSQTRASFPTTTTGATTTGPGRDGRGAGQGFRAEETRRPVDSRPVTRTTTTVRPTEGTTPRERPHEDRSRTTGRETAPDRGRTIEDRALPRERTPEGPSDRTTPRERPRDYDFGPRERPREDRPAPPRERVAPRDYDFGPRERPHEDRPAPRESPRPEAPRTERPSSPAPSYRPSSPSPAPSAPPPSRPSSPPSSGSGRPPGRS